MQPVRRVRRVRLVLAACPLCRLHDALLASEAWTSRKMAACIGKVPAHPAHLTPLLHMNTSARDDALGTPDGRPAAALESPARTEPEVCDVVQAGRHPASRRALLRRAALVVGAGVAAGGGYLAYRADGRRPLAFAALGEALQEVERLAAAGVRALEPATAWNWSQTLVHCAQSIEYSLSGFPAPRSTLFQNTLGAAAFHVFALRGRMNHDLAEPIPGAPALDASVPDASSALARLRQAVNGFTTHTGPLHPHFAYGPLSKGQYEQAHAMHLANHLSAFEVRGG